MRAPVVFLIFNRPDLTARSFARIAEARPSRLLVVADGPRAGRPGEEALCREARAAVRVSWPCELVTEYADENLGCRRRVSSGLHRAFELFESAVIVEDDCLPDTSFFPFADALLQRFADDERVMGVSGANLTGGRSAARHSYYFSRYFHCWGWASWRRAWEHYDVEMSGWPAARDRGWLEDLLGDPAAVRYWTEVFDRVHRGEIDTWDYQWTFACWQRGGLWAMPCQNLVVNAGFDERATHTRRRQRHVPRASSSVSFPLVDPPRVERDERADRFTERRVYQGSWHRRWLRRARDVVRSRLSASR